MQNFLGFAEEEIASSDQLEVRRAILESPTEDDGAADGEVACAITLPTALTPEEYFSTGDLNGRDIGQPQKMSNKVNMIHIT